MKNTLLSNVPRYPIKTALFEGSKTSPDRRYIYYNINLKMSMGHWWNDTDKGKLKYAERIITHLFKDSNRTSQRI